nr:hypothetical protein [Tanacetum cinerariifolium]
MKSLFLDISSSMLRELREKSLGCLFLVALSPQTYKRLHSTKNIWQIWPSINDIWPVKQGVIRALLHRIPLSLPGSPDQWRLKHLQAYQSRHPLHLHNLHPHPHQPNLKKRSASRPQRHLTSLLKLKKKSKYGFVGKKCTLKSVVESVAEDVPAKEPQVAAEDVDLQKALEESMKSMYDVPRGPLPPVVIRKPESGKYQPLPKVLRKGKAKVTEEQVSHDLLILQKPKTKSPTDQYIFQRRTSIPTRSSGHDESSYVELGKSDNEEESKKVVPRADEGGQEREHMDLDVTDVSPQPSTKQLAKGFTATAYPKGYVDYAIWFTRPSEASGALGASGSSQVPPPPPPPSSTKQESQFKGSAAPTSSKIDASAEYQAWTMTDIKLRPSISLTPADLEIDEDMAPDEQEQSSDDEDIRSAHIPKGRVVRMMESGGSGGERLGDRERGVA